MEARETVQRIARGELSARELMAETLAAIERLNPRVNALCTVLPADAAMELAADADAALAAGTSPGPLHGIPMAVKDLAATRGMRTTLGSRVFADHVPDHDALFVARLRAAGALIIGKTNTPELGAGSHTFNEVFGTTRNPYDLSKSAGGSSGGAAAALASRMLLLADGSDMGGSLRNPAAFCNVVGFRPSIGRVPSFPQAMAWQSRIAVEGPMARSVADCAWLLSVVAGPDPRDPLSLADSPGAFREPLERSLAGVRVAWTPDLGGLPFARAVVDVCAGAVRAFGELGADVSEAAPDLADAMAIFRTLRASFYAALAETLPEGGYDQLKETLRRNIDIGRALSARDLAEADMRRTALHQRVVAFFERHDVLALPTTQVLPFDIETEWVREIEGVRMGDYLDWMTSCCAITVTGCPAISVPCGFSPEGLPVGLQLVGRPRGDRELLEVAHAFERATGHSQLLPEVADA